MIDTLMALWNRGYGGKGVMVSIAFLVICISISLLLATVGGAWFMHAGVPNNQRSIVGAASLTATSQGSGVRPLADDTVTVLAPTATPTTPPCTNTPNHTSPTSQRNVSRPSPTAGRLKLTPTPTHIYPTPTPTPVKI